MRYIKKKLSMFLHFVAASSKTKQREITSVLRTLENVNDRWRIISYLHLKFNAGITYQPCKTSAKIESKKEFFFYQGVVLGVAVFTTLLRSTKVVRGRQALSYLLGED